MGLITPDLGLLFWTGLVFVLLLVILTKFIWKPILTSVNAREQKISDALELAEKTKAEMHALQAQNENLLKEARAERDRATQNATIVVAADIQKQKLIIEAQAAAE